MGKARLQLRFLYLRELPSGLSGLPPLGPQHVTLGSQPLPTQTPIHPAAG